jgi:hypothetical protein
MVNDTDDVQTVGESSTRRSLSDDRTVLENAGPQEAQCLRATRQFVRPRLCFGFVARIGTSIEPWGAYARRHHRELGAHHWLISDYSSGRRFSPIEKLVYSTAARDAELAGRVEDFATRSIGGIAGTRRMLARAAFARLGLAG